MDKRLVRYHHALIDLEAEYEVVKMLSLSMDHRATISKTITIYAYNTMYCHGFAVWLKEAIPPLYERGAKKKQQQLKKL